MKKSTLLRIPLQFFAEGGDGDGGAAGASTSTTGAGTGTTGATGAEGNNAAGNNSAPQNNNNDDMDARIEKLVQSKVDRITAELGKKNADLQKQNADLQKQVEKMKREKMSDEEVKELERQEREKAISDKEKALADKENRFYAIKALKTAGLDDGSDSALSLVDFVMGESAEMIDDKIKSFKTLFDKMVAAKVDATFKANGRTPNGASNGAQGDGKNNTIAEQLGKARAEQIKKSNDILNYYTGGKK